MEKWKDKNIDQKIEEQLSKLQLPFDDNELQRAKVKIMARIDSSENVASIQRTPQKIWMQVAASVAILLALSVGLLALGNTIIENKTTSQISHFLPDGSSIDANPGAMIRYNKFTWFVSREITFSGEAFFDVKPGSSFEVSTDQGNVRVLGTTFTIWSDINDLMVHCSSGKVHVSNDISSETLGPGEFTSQSKNGLFPKQALAYDGFYAPRKNTAKLDFELAPLNLVIHELELVFGIEIDCQLKTAGLLYSGSLNVEKIDESFEILCKPFGAFHSKNVDGTFVIYE